MIYPPLSETESNNIEIVVILGGNTLARLEKKNSPEVVAKEKKKRLLNKPARPELKEVSDRVTAINRVKNPLSINTKIEL